MIFHDLRDSWLRIYRLLSAKLTWTAKNQAEEKEDSAESDFWRQRSSTLEKTISIY